MEFHTEELPDLKQNENLGHRYLDVQGFMQVEPMKYRVLLRGMIYGEFPLLSIDSVCFSTVPLVGSHPTVRTPGTSRSRIVVKNLLKMGKQY